MNTHQVEADDARQWRLVDEGWGRRAVDFATLSEPGNSREYVSLHQQLAVGAGDRVLDIYTEVAASTLEFMMFDIDGDRLTGRAIHTDGGRLDRFELRAREGR